jgi:hypothetical protein
MRLNLKLCSEREAGCAKIQHQINVLIEEMQATVFRELWKNVNKKELKEGRIF